MCLKCISQDKKDRRSFLKLAAAGLAGSAMSSLVRPGQALAADGDFTITPDEALQKLKEGNAKFVADATACAANLSERRAKVAGAQHPYAVVHCCSDSRLTPELIFGGVTLGELFVARNAGNVIGTDVVGTLEYGTEHLHAPLIVVMGHKNCGAVGAAVDVVLNRTRLHGSIATMIEPILPVALAVGVDDPALADKTTRANALNGASMVQNESRIISRLVRAGKVRVVAAYYDLDSGTVEFLDAT